MRSSKTGIALKILGCLTILISFAMFLALGFGAAVERGEPNWGLTFLLLALGLSVLGLGVFISDKKARKDGTFVKVSTGRQIVSGLLLILQAFLSLFILNFGFSIFYQIKNAKFFVFDAVFYYSGFCVILFIGIGFLRRKLLKTR